MAARPSESLSELVDAIYEAAFFPEGWIELFAKSGLRGFLAPGYA